MQCTRRVLSAISSSGGNLLRPKVVGRAGRELLLEAQTKARGGPARARPWGRNASGRRTPLALPGHDGAGAVGRGQVPEEGPIAVAELLPGDLPLGIHGIDGDGRQGPAVKAPPQQGLFGHHFHCEGFFSSP